MKRTYKDKEEKKINNLNKEDIIEDKIYKSNNDYLLDILKDEEERLADKLGDILCGEIKYLFNRYISVRDIIEGLEC